MPSHHNTRRPRAATRENLCAAVKTQHGQNKKKQNNNNNKVFILYEIRGVSREIIFYSITVEVKTRLETQKISRLSTYYYDIVSFGVNRWWSFAVCLRLGKLCNFFELQYTQLYKGDVMVVV